jgi:hypothetical protein
MPRLEDDVKYWARGYLESLGYTNLTGENGDLPKDIRDRFTSKSGFGPGRIDIGGDFRSTRGYLLIAEIKRPGLFDDAVIDLRHYLNDLIGFDVVGWATDGIQGLWIIRSQDGKEETIDERYDQRP